QRGVFQYTPSFPHTRESMVFLSDRVEPHIPTPVSYATQQDRVRSEALCAFPCFSLVPSRQKSVSRDPLRTPRSTTLPDHSNSRSPGTSAPAGDAFPTP